MIVGLTGGIGSGKSTVAEIFRHIGIAVYEADTVSKSIIDTDIVLQRQLVELLGKEVINEGKINRKYMAGKIFNDKVLLEKANAMIHPAVRRNFDKWVKEQQTPYVIKEAAILFETGSYRQCDRVIVITAPQEMRIDRVMRRSNISREDVLARMQNQWPEEQKLKKADYIIKNDLKESLIKQVIAIHEDLIRQSNKAS